MNFAIAAHTTMAMHIELPIRRFSLLFKSTLLFIDDIMLVMRSSMLIMPNVAAKKKTIPSKDIRDNIYIC
jgi:hypothetical protein